jgi:hypothetical protein
MQAVPLKPWLTAKYIGLWNGLRRRRRTISGEGSFHQAGRSTRLQLHHHRSEHWVLSRNRRSDACKDVFSVTENESTEKLHLLNPGAAALEIIEDQSAQLCGTTTNRLTTFTAA